MAFFRFHRDKRGYEHFYLVEATTNRRGKSRARVLYWFRTPPNLKVGREPFDEEIRRALEAKYPEASFDWQKISETPIPSADAERWRERRRLERAEKAARRARSEEAGLEVDEEGEGVELPDTEPADVGVDAAEQQADALAPTEESLVSTAAGVDSSTPAGSEAFSSPSTNAAAAGGATPAPPGDSNRRRRRRRRRARRRDEAAAIRASGQPGQPFEAGEVREPRTPGEPLEPREPLEPGEPGEPLEPREPFEPHEAPEPREPDEPREPRDPDEPREPRDRG